MKIRKIVIASLLVFLAGAIIFTIGFSQADFDISRIGTDLHFQSKTFESNQTFQSINIEAKNVPVQIYRSSDNKISVSYSESERVAYEITEQGDTLNIKKVEREMNFVDHFSINFHAYNLMVYVPESFSGDILVTTSDSSIYVKDIKIKNLTLNTSSAKVTLADIEAAGNITASTSDASINVSDVTTKGDILCTTSNGSMAYDTVKANILHATTSNGSVALSDINASDSILTKTSNAPISFDSLDFKNALTCTSSNGVVKGTVIGKMPDFSLNCDTSNGTCNVPEKLELGNKDITLTTSNADITLEFTQDK